ncbi:MAG: dehydrogenase, partial [Verrucomicrobiae bacterium]|nr:dehydrogenase [Verrucomicrobiae bacterium]
MKRILFLIAGWLIGQCGSWAISPDNQPSADNSVEAELKSFRVHEDFEMSLFADESLGFANPIAIQWDHRGRLWVLCTLAYAQLRPGEVPDDKLYILEDTDGDGRADRSIVFADGLDMPTGFALGHGGAWIAVGPDLIHVRDADGDDRADQREVVLTGFGTGDTHQNISNLIFDAGGFLYFSQGLHSFSQVETPWGVSRGDTAGFWRFDPRVTRLDPFGFPSKVSQNPCGVALDRWGALFVKSNGPHLCFATPGLIATTHPRELMQFAQVGQTPGKSMGGDIVESAHLPDWIQ